MLSENDKQTLFRNLLSNRVTLFAGAGFSRGARNASARQVPLVDELARRLWGFLYETPYDGKTNLRTLYEAARTHKKGVRALREFLRSELHAVGFDDWYLKLTKWFWFRIYTTNADDLLEQVYETAKIPGIHKIVAPAHFQERDPFLRRVQLVKLHGCINDDSRELTFGLVDYGDRAAVLDMWYLHFIQDYSTRSTLFIGTQLDEPLFWQYIQLRQQRERDAHERRPKSFLVAPDISRPMEEVLERFNIVSVRATGQQFFEWLNGQIEAPTRENVLRALDPTLEPALRAAEEQLPLVEISLAEYFYSVFKPPHPSAHPRIRTVYLLGSPPTWDDIAANMDAHRDINERLRDRLVSALEKATADVVVLSSEAGGGKSTIAKRMAMELVGEGFPVFYSEGELRPDPDRLAAYIQKLDHRVLLVFDHAGDDLRLIAEFYEKVRGLANKPVVLAIARVNELTLRRFHLSKVDKLEEIRVPHLSDGDIEAVLGTLDRHAMLGELRKMSHADRVAVFRTKARKQILVAMREATSGRGFDDIIQDEFRSLQPAEAQLLYLATAIPSIENYGLTLPQMVSAMALPPNTTMLLATESLAGILVEEGEGQRFVIRHPAIAQFVVESVAPRQILAQAFVAFLRTIATVLPSGRERRWSRAFRVYRTTVNHARLESIFPGDIELVRGIYEDIKEYYADDGHYWLQYGSYELESGGALDAAENYINQANALMPHSNPVANATAHLLLKKAVNAKSAGTAEVLMQDGLRILRAQMADQRTVQAHPYHIFGSQMISYVRRWVPLESRVAKFREVHDELRRSIPNYLQNDANLRRLLEDIKRAELELAVRPR